MIRGRCHCGAVGLEFDTRLAPEALNLRRCGCSFCQKHGACTTSDPEGTVRFLVPRPEHLKRYRFGLRTADFLLCGNCGAYLAALIEVDGRGYATLNANCFELEGALTQEAPLVQYEGETAEQRTARRMAKWTPISGGIQFGTNPAHSPLSS